jgi:alkyl sulfatase BDS1-like metallo-beta-lactamase superfamily hydrolase
MPGSHGIPVVGADHVREALQNTARYLETLVDQALVCLNDGATLVETLRRVRVPDDLAALCGSAQALADRALDLAHAGSHRLACHLAQLAGDAAPDDTAVHTARAEVYALRAAQERSSMSTGIFTWAEAESRGVIAGTDAMTELTSSAPPQ